MLEEVLSGGGSWEGHFCSDHHFLGNGSAVLLRNKQQTATTITDENKSVNSSPWKCSRWKHYFGESANLCCSLYVFKIYQFLQNLFTVNPYYYLLKVVGLWGRVKDSHICCIHKNAPIKMQIHTEAVIIDCLREEKAYFSHLRIVVKVKSGLQSII